MPSRKTCLETAVGLLSRREYSQAEMVQKLRDKSFPLPEVQEVVAGLVQKGYVDDKRYAEVRARYRATQSRWGWQKVQLELRARGVGNEDIEAARNALQAEGISFAAEAEHLATLRVGRRSDGGEDAEKNEKLVQSLIRRGYTLEEARKAVEAATEEA